MTKQKIENAQFHVIKEGTLMMKPVRKLSLSTNLILSLSLLCLLSLQGLGWAKTWQELLQERFDIVETFDNLQNWHGVQTNSSSGCSSAPSDQPKRLDGTPSHWGRYCFYSDLPGSQRPDWIQEFTPADRIGTKSLTLAGDGPAYMSMYYGKGSPNSGYTDFYTFFRLRLPHNAFPTYIADANTKTVGYRAGEPYLYLDSWKFVNFNTGFSTVDVFNDEWNATLERQYDTRYGDTEIWFHIKTDENKAQRLILETFFSQYAYFGFPNILKFDQWIGLEFHLKLDNPAGLANGVAEVWVYDDRGNASLALRATDVRFRPAGADNHLFNRIQLDGNKQEASLYVYRCGPGMECNYHVDDFIIDDQPIGPTYFSLFNGPTIPDTTPPAAPTGMRVR